MNNYFNYLKAKELIEAKIGIDKTAVLLKISRASLYNYLKGNGKGAKEPPLSIIIELSKLLEIEPGELISIPVKIEKINLINLNDCVKCKEKDGVIKYLESKLNELEKMNKGWEAKKGRLSG